MKTDKILFCAACVGMGIMMHSNLNRNESDTLKPKSPQTILSDSSKLKPLTQDSAEFSNAIKADTLKLLKKIK